MRKSRLEAFSDGVLAIIITIMVLELKPPHSAEWEDLAQLTPLILSYILSFLYIGIYWNNHHHLLQAADKVNGSILWANLHLLFWLSLLPFVTAWSGANHFSEIPMAAYGLVLLFSGIAYFILSRSLIRHHGKESALAQAIGSDRKGKVSVGLYAVAIPLALKYPLAALAIYIAVAIIWIIPDSRIENSFRNE